MNPYDVLSVELALLVLLVGAVIVGRLREPQQARQWAIAFSAVALVLMIFAWQSNLQNAEETPERTHSLLEPLVGRSLFQVDLLSAPLLAATALLHFLTFVSTQRTKLRRFKFEWALASEALALGTFACTEPWPLVAFLAAATIPPYLELRDRQKPTRVYAIHMGLFIGLLVLGQSLVGRAGPAGPSFATALPIALAVMIRCGIAPFHCWLTDLFEHTSFGTALLRALPLTGVYAAVRLLIPIAPEGALWTVAVAATISSVYAAGMSLVQREARRFFCYLFLSLSAPVLVGLDSGTEIGVTGALCTWISVALSLGGFGLMLRGLEARFGRLSLTSYHGYFEQTPTLAVCFALTGLASIGFPGTIGFQATEMLIDGAVESHPYAGVALILSTALTGIAALRVYFLLFTGARHQSDVSLQIRVRERIAVLTIAVLVLGGGLWSQPWIASRHAAAERLLSARAAAVRGVKPIAAARGPAGEASSADHVRR